GAEHEARDVPLPALRPPAARDVGARADRARGRRGAAAPRAHRVRARRPPRGPAADAGRVARGHRAGPARATCTGLSPAPLRARATGENAPVFDSRGDLGTVGSLREVLHCRAARPVATFDDRVVVELVVASPDRDDVRDLARVQYIDGPGEASSTWQVTAPVP